MNNKELCKQFLSEAHFRSDPNNVVESSFEKVKDIATKVVIKNGKPYFTKPNKHHDRYEESVYVVNKICEERVGDCSFIIILNDCYGTKFPAFSAIRPQEKNKMNIPFPMGNRRGIETGFATPIKDWDYYIKKIFDHPPISWGEKSNKAVFRGQLSMQTWKVGKYGSEKALTWADTARGRLYQESKGHENLLDIGFHKTDCVNFTKTVPPLSLEEQQKYKYIISVGSNAEWAERVRTYLFSSSLLIKHEAESIEWFYPMIKPWVHYVPIRRDMKDTLNVMEWVVNNDLMCQQIVRQANDFAKHQLSEEAMIKFGRELIKTYYHKFFHAGNSAKSIL